MNKVQVNIWGRNFELDVCYQNFPDEEVTDNQRLTLDSLPSINYAESLPHVEQYIMKYNGNDVKGESIDNIFSYVMPKSIVITREDDDRVFALFCNYKFDVEHGLAVVYKNESYKAVGAQDIVL